MKNWKERPVEVANLLNPAFCGEVISIAVREYNNISLQGFPFALVYMILPIVLHKKTRDRINLRGRVPMHVWLQDNQDLKVNFSDRAREMAPICRESLLFLMQLDVIEFDNKGELFSRNIGRVRKRSGEVLECVKKSEYLGRWLSNAGSESTIFAMWGVRP